MDSKTKDHRRWFVEDGEPGFSPARNKAVVERTIKKYEAKRRRQMRDFDDALRERSHAVASYLKSKAVDSGKPIEKYLGKRTLAYLRGEDIVNKIRNIIDPTITRRDIVNAARSQKRQK